MQFTLIIIVICFKLFNVYYTSCSWPYLKYQVCVQGVFHNIYWPKLSEGLAACMDMNMIAVINYCDAGRFWTYASHKIVGHENDDFDCVYLI